MDSATTSACAPRKKVKRCARPLSASESVFFSLCMGRVSSKFHILGSPRMPKHSTLGALTNAAKRLLFRTSLMTSRSTLKAFSIHKGAFPRSG
jgi:hypothetical protein